VCARIRKFSLLGISKLIGEIFLAITIAKIIKKNEDLQKLEGEEELGEGGG
jgi:hypothetical protein